MSKTLARWTLHAVLLPLDYFASGVLWQYPGMTVSARCEEELARWPQRKGWRARLLRLLGRMLNRLDADHCFDAVNGDIGRIDRTRARLQDILAARRARRAATTGRTAA